MTFATKLTFLVVIVLCVFAFGYDVAFNYAAKFRHQQDEFRVRIAQIDLWSYLLTSVPLFSGMILLLNKDPMVGGVFDVSSSWSDATTMSFALIAAIGIGAGVARRRLALISVKNTWAN